MHHRLDIHVVQTTVNIKVSGICKGVMVFNTSFNSISAILWLSVLLVEQTGVPWQTLSHNVVSSTPWHDVEILEHPVYEKNVIWILKYRLNMRM